ncbi:MAG TPA: hypothetical protein VJA94_07025 [Candidatus Angelobacter sp.]
MNRKNVVFALLIGSLILGAAEPSSMKPVSRAHLCITEGQIKQLSGARMSVIVPKMRAFVTDPTLQEVEAHFTYLGPAGDSVPLASGEMRRQFGLKLRAQDGCNLVYAMWRIEPTQELVVSVKSNPGMTKSSECDAHGYHTIKPTRDINLPQIVRGKKHTLRAIIEGTTMRVYADNKLVWEGIFGAEPLAFNGPVGVRTDNGQFHFELFAGIPAAGQKGASAECHKGGGEE